MSSFDDMLNFDPLDTAMKMTSKDYSTDEETMDLGIALHLLHSKNKQEELALRNDTYWSMPYAESLPIFDDLGFQVVFVEKIDEADEYTLLWREDGILLEIDSYTPYADAVKILNSIRFHYNWRPNDVEKSFGVTGSGGFIRRADESEQKWEEDKWIWSGHNDAKNALRHQIAKLEASGAFLPVWVEAPLLTFCHRGQDDESYANWDEEKEAWNVRFKQVVAHLPTELGEMLSAANKRL